MTDKIVLVERRGSIATITLNRPAQMNALSHALRQEFAKTLEALESDPDIRVLILTGAGNRAFCAGLDLKELAEGGQSVGAAAGGSAKDPVTCLTSFSGPVIGAINGVAITGGFEVALACDILIGTRNTRFADTHGRVGVMPGWGLSQRLSRAIGIYRAKELSLTGNFLDAETALDWGLLNRIVPEDELLAVCNKLADDMVSMDADFQKTYLKLIDDGFALSFGEGMKLEAKENRSNANVGNADVGSRLADVFDRGRAQQI